LGFFEQRENLYAKTNFDSYIEKNEATPSLRKRKHLPFVKSTRMCPARAKRLRSTYMGRNPVPGGPTVRAIEAAELAAGYLRTRAGKLEFFDRTRKKWFPRAMADLCHVEDAVLWWNRKGYKYGPRAFEVRKWMLDPSNYYLGLLSINRSQGARLRVGYRPPA
jgi:hypothetical protein